MSTHDAFARDLAEVINRHSVENVSDTPDVVLGAFLVECLDAFDAAVNERARLAARPDEQPQGGTVPDLWWPFTGGADTCYLNHDDDGGYRECCMRAGLAYALKVRGGDEVHTPTVEYAAVFAAFWLVLVYGVLAEMERAKGVRR